MKRRLFYLLVGVSLALCVVSVVLWVRSHFTTDVISVDCGTFGLHLLHIEEDWVEFPKVRRGMPGAGQFYIADPLDFRFGVALSWVSGFFAVNAAFWLIQLRRLKIAGRGLCRKCGYDLRATPDRCPECGTAASNTK